MPPDRNAKVNKSRTDTVLEMPVGLKSVNATSELN